METLVKCLDVFYTCTQPSVQIKFIVLSSLCLLSHCEPATFMTQQQYNGISNFIVYPTKSIPYGL